MPIKYQMLGGGGGIDLLLKVVPNVSVTLSRDIYTKTATTNSKGQVLFKNLSDGTYTATVRYSDGTQYQKEILVSDAPQEEGFATQKIANLPTGSKIKFSSGRKFVLMKHKAKAHGQNSATLVSEFIQENYAWVKKNSVYFENTDFLNFLYKYFYELTDYEKNNILEFNADDMWAYDSSNKYTVKQRFYLLSLEELGVYGDAGRNLGFDGMTSRIKRHESGGAYRYFSRSCYYTSSSNYSQNVIEADGDNNKFTWEEQDETTFDAGIVLGVDISENAKVYLDTDGYYRLSDK